MRLASLISELNRASARRPKRTVLLDGFGGGLNAPAIDRAGRHRIADKVRASVRITPLFEQYPMPTQVLRRQEELLVRAMTSERL